MRVNSRHEPTSRREEGFSLVELLVAIFVFGLVMVPVTGAFISATGSINDQRLRTAATRVATGHLERLRSLPFEQLDGQAGETVATTPDGRAFSIQTVVTQIDAATGQPATGGPVRQVTVTVRWTVGGDPRNVSYTTAIAPEDSDTVAAAQSIRTVTMFPSPGVADATGRPLEDVQVTVTLEGFAANALVHLSWSNADGTSGAKTLTSTSGVNWTGTIPKVQLRAALSSTGRGEVQFSVAAGSLATVHTLALQASVASPPAITAATIDRNPVTVARPAAGRTCSDRNQCQNTTDVVFVVTATGLDPTQDSVIVQYQLADGTFQELPLAPTADQWRLTVRQRTTRFRTGTTRAFRFSATRSADSATAARAVERDVVSV